MKIILLGTGTPVLDPTRQQSALVVDIDGTKILFDAGRGATSQMAKAGIQPQQVNAIFITHHHYDHISDLGEFLLSAWYAGRETALTVYGPPGTAAIVSALLRQVFARDIAFTLSYDENATDIRDLVQVMEISSGWSQESGTWKVHAEAVEHGSSREAWHCLGYRLEAEGKIIAISGDTVACAGLDQLAHHADVLVQCCYLAEDEITTPAAERQASTVIASSGQVGKIAARNQVKTLVLTHIRPKSEPLMRSLIADVRRDYTGALVLGEDLMILEV